ncbi:MAG: hypothetical protein P8Y73_13015, partial [Desulfuromonadales bacterium]
RHARGIGKSAGAAFEQGDRLFHLLAARVAAAGIVIGPRRAGVMKVLSSMVSSWCSRAISTIVRKSVTRKRGLEGVSKNRARVCGVIAASTASGSVVSTRLHVMPWCGRTPVR